MNEQTVLVIGASGNTGTAAVIAALNKGLKVLAVVRSEASEKKLFKNVGTREGITTVEADVTSFDGLSGVVEKVKQGKLPAFQHVYSSVGGHYWTEPLTEISPEQMQEMMKMNFLPNFLAYRATMPYLLEQNDPSSTWTICNGAAGDVGTRAAPGISQGAVVSLAAAGCRENEKTNVRFNEIYLSVRVEADPSAGPSSEERLPEFVKFHKSSEFANVYEEILEKPQIRSSRIVVLKKEDFQNIKYKSRLVDPMKILTSNYEGTVQS